MDSNSTGNQNTAIGYNALYTNTTGSGNVAVGENALSLSTTASNNVAIGDEALGANTTGTQNTAVGKDALTNANGTHHYNTAVGYGALGTQTTATRNTAMGRLAAQVLTTGDNNTCIGEQAGYNITNGHSNVYVGQELQGSAVDVNHEYVIGQGTGGNGSGTFYVHSSNGAYNGQNTTTWAQTSDQRIKKNITNFDTGLSVINQLQVRNFEYKTQDEIKADNPELTDVLPSVENVLDISGVQKGLIAQEAEAVDSKFVTTPSTGVKALVPDEIFWHMLNAIKELSTKNDELVAANTALSNRVTALES